MLAYLDDILIIGPSQEEHMANLKEVLSRLNKAGLRLHKDKCEFMVPVVKYLGHIIDAKGLHPPTPQYISEIKAYYLITVNSYQIWL